MELRISWPRPRGNHGLLSRPKVVINNELFDIDAMELEPKLSGDSVVTKIGIPLFQRSVHLRIRFDDVPPNPPRLVISQFFEIHNSSVVDTHYRVHDPDAQPQPQFRDVRGRHPLLTSKANQGIWRIEVKTDLVDVTSAFGTAVGGVNPANGSSIRVLARTDGVVPAFWVTCTPKRCRRAPASDILCFLTSPAGAAAANIKAQMTDAAKREPIRTWGGVFLGQGDHNAPSTIRRAERFLDHFTERPPDRLNFIIARGWEQALVDSKRHVSLVMPVPASTSHNQAGTARLPKLLRNVDDFLRAAGDVTPPAGGELTPPRLGLAGHSLGACAAFDALKASTRGAFSNVILFDPNEAQNNKHLLLQLLRTPTRVCLVGFWPETTVEPFRTLMRKHREVRDHFVLLPQGHGGKPDPIFSGGKVPEPDKALLADLMKRSPRPGANLNPRSLTHALDGLPPAVLAALLQGERSNDASTRSRVKHVVKRMQHQYIVLGGDDQGSGQPESHFLTQALQASTLR